MMFVVYVDSHVPAAKKGVPNLEEFGGCPCHLHSPWMGRAKPPLFVTPGYLLFGPLDPATVEQRPPKMGCSSWGPRKNDHLGEDEDDHLVCHEKNGGNRMDRHL